MKTHHRDAALAHEPRVEAGAARRGAWDPAARSHRRALAALLGFALGVLMGLLYAPNSGWLVRMQAGIFLPSARPVQPDIALPADRPVAHVILDPHTHHAEDRLRAAALDRPDDAAAQAALAARAVYLPGPEGRPADPAARFAPVLRRFPNSPEVYAAALRVMAGRTVRLPDPDHAGSRPPRGQDLAAFDRWAARGEKLDPDNAFFPAMRAAGLYAAERDAEARAALARAAGKPHWREYLAEEAAGAWRLSNAAFGFGNPVARSAMVSSITLTHDHLLKDMAEHAVKRARDAERAGRTGEGTAIRRDLLRLGGRMRAHSSSLVGALAGSSIQQAAARTGTSDTLTAAERDAFAASLRRAGYAREAASAARELESRDRVLRVASAGLDRYDMLRGLRPFGRGAAAGSGLLLAAAWLGLWAVAAYWARRRARHAVTGYLVPLAALGAFALIPLLALTSGPATGIPGADADAARALWAALFTPALLLAALTVAARFRRTPVLTHVRRDLPAAATAAACLLLLVHGGVTLQTLRFGAAANRTMARMVEHEGVFYAGLTGQVWPD